jgi:hypothetical protein
MPPETLFKEAIVSVLAQRRLPEGSQGCEINLRK